LSALYARTKGCKQTSEIDTKSFLFRRRRKSGGGTERGERCKEISVPNERSVRVWAGKEWWVSLCLSSGGWGGGGGGGGGEGGKGLGGGGGVRERCVGGGEGSRMSRWWIKPLRLVGSEMCVGGRCKRKWAMVLRQGVKRPDRGGGGGGAVPRPQLTILRSESGGRHRGIKLRPVITKGRTSCTQSLSGALHSCGSFLCPLHIHLSCGKTGGVTTFSKWRSLNNHRLLKTSVFSASDRAAPNP